jgi:hypothetical protein
MTAKSDPLTRTAGARTGVVAAHAASGGHGRVVSLDMLCALAILLVTAFHL